MPASTARNSPAAYSEPNDRQAGTLVMTERWWRDRYDDIEKQGYRLRPRYHPQWVPSWSKTGKDFYTAEDGQATIVRAFAFISCPSPYMPALVEGSNGRDSHTRWPSRHAQESPPRRRASRIEYQPAFLVAREFQEPRQSLCAAAGRYRTVGALRIPKVDGVSALTTFQPTTDPNIWGVYRLFHSNMRGETTFHKT